MLSFYAFFVSTGAHALAEVIVNSQQTGILVTLGSLLVVLGSVLRRKLSVPDEATSSYAATLRVDPIPLNSYIDTMNPATSQRHANAV
jgi:hypothetical protein